MEAKDAGFPIEVKGKIILSVIGIVVPMEGHEALSTQKTYLWGEKESWECAKVFLEESDGTFHIESRELKIRHVFKKNDIGWWSYVKDKNALLPINPHGREVLGCMVEQYEKNRKNGKRTLRK